MDRAVTYCRVSTRPQEDKYGMAAQLEMTMAYCLARGYNVVEVLREVHTGKELDERPQMTRLRQMLDQGDVDTVVTVAVDRFARSAQHYAVVEYEIERAGVRHEYVAENYDVSTAKGRLMRSLMSNFADIEWEKTRERSMNGKRERARQGKLIPSSIPLFGYRWVGPDKVRYEPHPITCVIVVRIFTDVAAGKRLNAICAELMREGIPSPRDFWRMEQGKPPLGRPWQRQTLSNMLRNPVYTGRVLAFRHDHTGRRRDVDPITGQAKIVHTHVVKADDECVVIPDGAPALVSEELALAARARLQANREEASRNYHGPITALLRAGYIVCDHCGHRFHVRQAYTTRETPRYYCPSQLNAVAARRVPCPVPRVKVDEIDSQVWGIVSHRISDPAWIVEGFNRRQQDDGMTERTLAGMDVQAADVERKRDSLVKAIALTQDDGVREAFVREMESLADDIRRIEEQREALRAIAADREAMRNRVEQFAAWCEEAAQALDEEATYEQRRLFLYVLGAKVRVVGGTLREPQWVYEDMFGSVESPALVSISST